MNTTNPSATFDKLMQILAEAYKKGHSISDQATRLLLASYLIEQGIAIREHAHWIDDQGGYECSNCNHFIDDTYYLGAALACPNCSALIDAVTDKDNNLVYTCP